MGILKGYHQCNKDIFLQKHRKTTRAASMPPVFDAILLLFHPCAIKLSHFSVFLQGNIHLVNFVGIRKVSLRFEISDFTG